MNGLRWQMASAAIIVAYRDAVSPARSSGYGFHGQDASVRCAYCACDLLSDG